MDEGRRTQRHFQGRPFQRQRLEALALGAKSSARDPWTEMLLDGYWTPVLYSVIGKVGTADGVGDQPIKPMTRTGCRVPRCRVFGILLGPSREYRVSTAGQTLVFAESIDDNLTTTSQTVH